MVKQTIPFIGVVTEYLFNTSLIRISHAANGDVLGNGCFKLQ